MKNKLLFFLIPAIILYRKVAGLIMQGLKKIWNNWQWVLPVGALLLSVFTWYYKTSTEIPARILDCEKHLSEHITKSDEHFKRIDENISDLNVLNAGISAQLEAIKEDTTITKKLVFELLGKRL